jgi:CRISPR-associated protein Cas1
VKNLWKLFRSARDPATPVPAVESQIIHLVGPGTLRVHNGRLEFRGPPDRRLVFSAPQARNVLCYGRVTLTSDALRLLLAASAHVSLLTVAGDRCRGYIAAPGSAHPVLRILQAHVLLDPKACLEFARTTVRRKIQSAASAAEHYQHNYHALAAPALRTLRAFEAQCGDAASLGALRGLEGAASVAWFGLLCRLLRPPFTFTRRTRRPPTDPANSLLSLGYALLLRRVTARAEAWGFDSFLGALHVYRPGRPSLICDLVEPLRVPAVDRWMLALCNQGRVALEHFRRRPGDATAVELTPDAFPDVLAAWEGHWHDHQLSLILDRTLQQANEAIRQAAHEIPALTSILPAAEVAVGAPKSSPTPRPKT